jgi:hypothetical protein
MRRPLRTIHVGLVLLVTAAVLVQAALAGQFVSGLSNALPAHGAVGGVLELIAPLLLVTAIAHRLSGERAPGVLSGSIVLALAVEVQAGLGWAPGAVPTAVHVPLGVAIFAGAVALSTVMVRTVAATRRSGGHHATPVGARAGVGRP